MGEGEREDRQRWGEVSKVVEEEEEREGEEEGRRSREGSRGWAERLMEDNCREKGIEVGGRRK